MRFDEVWTRISEATGWQKYGEMADFLEIKSQSVSGAKSRGTFPIEWAFKIAQGFDLSTDWLLTGKGAGAGDVVDKEFFLKVAYFVDSVIEEKRAQVSKQQLLLHYLNFYGDFYVNKIIDKEAIREELFPSKPKVFLACDDETITSLLDLLVKSEVKTAKEEKRARNSWWEKIAGEFDNRTSLLFDSSEKPKIISFLKQQLEERIRK